MTGPYPNSTHTIAAIATPPGRGGVGIVRVSGPAAERVVRTLVPDWPDDQPSHQLRLSTILDAEGRVVDEALVVAFHAPHTYTGEDVVELQCHGGPVILRRVLDACLTAGCRIARPGEFTERAFLNGRLDLTQAEAVADLVNATSEAAHALAIEHLRGALGESVRQHLERLTEAMVLVEAAIDFSHEEHVYPLERERVRRRVETALESLRDLRRRFDRGRRIREGVRVVIVGPTNAGKSSLFNALLGEERAIVTDVEGTTRDWLEEELDVQGVTLRLIDTAGLRHTDDAVEQIGIQRSRALAAEADVIVFVVDRSRPLDPEARSELLTIADADVELIVCRNKADLPQGLTEDDLAALEGITALDTSFLQSGGAGALVNALGDVAVELTAAEGVLLSRARHLQAVTAAIHALERTSVALDDELDHELVALDLRDALDALGSIVGHVSTDDILNRIFGEFCVGK